MTLRERLDAVAILSADGIAVVKVPAPNGALFPKYYYKDGRALETCGPMWPWKNWVRIYAARGKLKWALEYAEWEPRKPKHPLDLLAGCAE